MHRPLSMLAMSSLLVLSGCVSQIFLDSMAPEPQQVASADRCNREAMAESRTRPRRAGGDEVRDGSPPAIGATAIP